MNKMRRLIQMNRKNQNQVRMKSQQEKLMKKTRKRTKLENKTMTLSLTHSCSKTALSKGIKGSSLDLQ